MKLGILLLLVVWGTSACDSQITPGKDGVIDEVLEDDPAPDFSSWITFDADGKFSFDGPPELVDREVEGIDSFVGLYDAESISVQFDYGNATLPSDDCWDALLTCRFEDRVFGPFSGRVFEATLPSSQPERGSIRYLAWADVEQINAHGTRLSLIAYSFSPADTTALVAIARSVSFPE